MMPGTFSIFGVPFSITERDKATYTKNFTPAPTQKWLIDFQIAVASNSGDTISDDMRKLKVADALTKLQAKGLRYTINLPGFSANPWQPPPTMTLGDYLSRGGYLIDLDRAEGKKRIAGMPNGRMACTTFCKDPASGLPFCTATVNASNDLDTVSHWDIYATVGPTYTITAKYKEYDPSWYQSAANAVGGLLSKALKELCSPGTDTNKYATQAFSTASEKSTDPIVKAWATGMSYTLAKCGQVYTPKAAITPMTPEAPMTPAAPTAPMGPSAPVSVRPPKYQGCVSRFHKARNTFSVYCPVDWKAPAGLGADVSPPPPASTIKVAEESVAPPEAPNVGTEDDPFYKKWWFWAIVGGAAAATGAGGYAVVRYRRRKS